MSVKFNVHEAKTHLSKLLIRALNGEEIIIARAGIPVVRLVPLFEKSAKRTAGSAKNTITIARDFEAPLPEAVIKEFEQ
jgi:prevent-host-death family protein